LKKINKSHALFIKLLTKAQYPGLIS